MYCTKCGNELSEDSTFCTKCGNKISNVKINNTINNNKKRKKNMLVTIIIVIAISIFIIDVIYSTIPKENISDISQTYYIGDTIDLGDFSVKLENYQIKEKGDRIDDYSVIDDPQWIAIFLTYTNKSSNEKIIPKNIRLINGNGEELEQPILYYNVWNGEHLDKANLISGGSKTGFVVFTNTKIDKVEDFVLQISTNSSFNKKNTFNFKLKNK